MPEFAAILSQTRLLAQLQQRPADCRIEPFHLVGGAIREALLSRAVVDLDFTSPHDLTACAQALARQCHGHWFWLDQERRQSRVLVDGMTCDFVPWRADTLKQDLALRDYTINAMALDLTAPLSVTALIDPLGGRHDLEQRRLRMAGPGVLHDDPLRILKGVRHVAQLELEIEPATLAAMQAAAPGLLQVAPERVRSEFWQILAAPAASRGLEGLYASGAGHVLFGPSFRAALPFVHGVLKRTRELFAILDCACPHTRRWLSEPVEQHLDRSTLLIFNAVLHAIETTLPLRMARNWRCGRVATARLAALAGIRSVLWAELARLPHRPRAVAQWALQFGPDPVDLLLGVGLHADLPPLETARRLIPFLALLGDLDEVRQLPNLVDGTWLADELGLEGAMIGVALAALKRAEIYGGVANVDAAHSFLRREFGKRD
jgi:poly(A) polymerase